MKELSSQTMRVGRHWIENNGDLHLSVIVPFSATFSSKTVNSATGLEEGYTATTIPQKYPNGDPVEGTIDTFGKYYNTWKKTIPSTRPNVRGTAAVILAPGNEPNWISKIGDNASLQELYSADNEASGIIVPSNMNQYYCNSVTITLTPYGNEVDASKVIDEMKEAYTQAENVSKLPKHTAVKPDQRRPVRRTAPIQQQQDERNATVTDRLSTTYGTVVRQMVDSGPATGDEISPMYYISYPASYNGVIEYFLSFVENPNTIWSMNEVDLSSGPQMWTVRNVDVGRSFMVRRPKTVPLKEKAADAENVTVDRTFKLVNVKDLTASWGAFVIMVQKPYVDAALETWEYTDNSSGTPVQKHVLTPKGVLHGTIEYDIVFKSA